jgi:hypothetical protein
MLTIRQEQVASLDDAMERRYCEELRTLLRTKFPQLVGRLEGAVLLDRIAVSVQQARSYGVRSGEGILAYVGLSLAAGPSFDTNPKVRDFLALSCDDSESKVHWLFKRVVDTLRQVEQKSGRGPKKSTSGA